MTAALEEPVDPFGAGVYVVSEIARRHVTVALGGDGGDELFAGYDRYKGQALAELYAHLPRALRHGVLRPIFKKIPDSFGYNSFAKAALARQDHDSNSPVGTMRRTAFPHALKRIFARGVARSRRNVGEERSAVINDGCAERTDKMRTVRRPA
jgi:asparagine synthetase B (glutamine-hydrolysing)